LLVYGDHSEKAVVAGRLTSISEQLEAISGMADGIDRHAKLVGALISAGQLLQGLADSGVPSAAVSEFVHSLAACAVASWDSGFAHVGTLPAAPDRIDDRQVELRLPEGFAFYAVYPEAYVEAARKLKLLGPPRVIGIRSIGTTLGPIVSAAIGAPPAATVRPFGDPFARQVEAPPDIIEAGAHYIIVDEGPGLSGSSFGAVADWLEARGVSLEHVAFLPSHAGDLGPLASDAHRSRWSKAQRIAAQFDPAFLEQRFGPLTHFSGGGAWQRQKYVGMMDGKPVLLKFAGLGAIGESKLQIARTLHAAGFTPEPLGLVHGFIVERWLEDAQPLGPGDKPLLEVGRYLGARARLLAAPGAPGASVDELLAMCRRNIGLALGEGAAELIDRFDAAKLGKRVVRVRTDNKVEPQEWLRLTDGRLLKADALDHHQAHDLIGCQAVEWDIAGVIQEFELEAHEANTLIEATQIEADPELLDFYRLAYAAFRLGQSELANDRSAAQRYASAVEHLLLQNS
jgi:hypothetical protein